jgi:enediyne biosynthesis protein E4
MIRGWAGLCVLLLGCAPPVDVPDEVEPTPEPTPSPTPEPTPSPTPPIAAGEQVWGTSPVEFPPPPPPPPPPCPVDGDPVETVFARVEACAGIDAPHTGDPGFLGVGQAWADVDGDGRLDLYTTQDGDPNSLWMQTEPGLFVDAEAAELALDGVDSAGATFADFDNDGDPDLFVANVGANNLFRNDGGAWVDVADEALAGMDETYLGLWADYDRDGHTDLYVVNHCTHPCEWYDVGLDRLWRNVGDGTFEDVSDVLPELSRSGVGLTGSWFDMDDDGDQDLYVINDRGGGETPEGGPLKHNALFRNDGPGCGSACFTDISIGSGTDLGFEGMGVATGDIDGDGDLDVYVSDGSDSTLLENLGAGLFVDSTLALGAEQGKFSWGAVFFDYDNDGWLDLAVAVGIVDDDRDNDDLLLRNDGGVFVDVSDGSGLDSGGISLGLAAADYDGDGRVDLATSDRFEGFGVARNMSDAGGWLSVRLEGSGPVARDAIGARATLLRSDGLELVREVQSGGSFGSGSDLALHFGLGDAAAVSLTIRWPEGTLQVIEEPGADEAIVVLFGR